MEKVADVLVLAMEKTAAAKLDNVKFALEDAEALGELLPEHSIDTLYLNFCDPWPKRNAKRRLTFRKYLDIYKKFLKSEGRICFKTDNLPLFEFSLQEFEDCGFKLEKVTYDLHSSEYNTGNIMTEYEKNFSEKGVKINRLEAFLPLD